MGKRSKDRATGRPPEGGLRKTVNVRELSRAIARPIDDPLARIGGRFFTPDLTAFDAPAALQPVRAAAALVLNRPQAVRAGSNRSIVREPSKRSLEAAASPRRVADPVNHAAPIKRPTLASPVKTQAKTASKVVSHEVRPARLDNARSCKERPRDTKRGAGGGKKSFVPWCTRKR